jgi:enoyl-CoA hydratase/long-chain 3-hydroxyacyl-CoA dehydrogenase
LTEKALEYQFVRNFLFNKVKAQVMGQTKGLYPAPLRILDVVRTGVERGPDAGYEAEAQGFADLGMTNESKALINIFHGHINCKKNRFGNPKVEAK